jgi:hypothetical protein
MQQLKCFGCVERMALNRKKTYKGTGITCEGKKAPRMAHTEVAYPSN